MIDDLEDERRREPDFSLGEREMLEQWLEFHRTTLLLKCEGLQDAPRKARPIATSKLSLHGLIRHMAEVERNWFSGVLAGDTEFSYIYGDFEDAEFSPLDEANWEDDLGTWHAESASSLQVAATHGLDDTGLRHGQPADSRRMPVVPGAGLEPARL
ncbi:MAG: DUF664 domain-containing protein [Actinobacteria bacterium]|nr:DUF664 domain-containing protein [Actinomycetota bacterium]